MEARIFISIITRLNTIQLQVSLTDKAHTQAVAVVDSIAVSVFVVILVEFDKSKTSRLVWSVALSSVVEAMICSDSNSGHDHLSIPLSMLKMQKWIHSHENTYLHCTLPV